MPSTRRPRSFSIDQASGLSRGSIYRALGAMPGTSHFHDSGPCRNHGVLTNMTPADDWFWSQELGRQYVDLDGINDVIDVEDDGDLDIPIMSIAFWLYARATNIYARILATSSDFTNKYAIAFGDSGSLLGINGVYNDGTEYDFRTPDISLNTWTHVFFAWDGSAISMYIDGAAVSDQGSEGGWLFKNTNSSNLWIGRRQDDAYAFPGGIADVMIWNRVLTAPEVRTLANRAEPMLGGLIRPLSRRARRLVKTPAAGPSIPVIQHHRQQQRVA